MLKKILENTQAFVTGFRTTFKYMFKPAVTVNYPDQKAPMFPKWRGKQVLMRDEAGLEKCVACGLCAVACPADAIYLEAAENDGTVLAGPRYAITYQIHKTRCIFCGYCEEACPVDAIKLGPEYELADFTRPDFVYTKEMLLEPEKYAPKRQFHADVDATDDNLERVPETGQLRSRPIPDDLDLGEVYRRHRPLK
jgi:NADH-quinone oxidoreductase subunit I